MAKNKGLFSEIISRKIPHIIGMYIASVWLAVEISDWMSGRFDLSNQFAIYVFIGMLSFLPSVILVAWGHGKPGKDKWTIAEKSWIPINIIIAIFAIMYLVNPLKESQQQDIPSKLINQHLLEKQSQLPTASDNEIDNKASHQSVVAYFWENKTQDKDLDWVSYGASWLLSEDLKRTPLISVTTPYDSTGLLTELLKKGFDTALGVPLSLAKKIAQNRSAKWLVQGSFKKINEQLELTANLYNVETGKQVKTMTEIDDNWLVALDRISNKLGSVILTTANVTTNIIPELAILAHTSDNIKAIESLISAKNSVSFDNDFQLALTSLFTALDIDKSFAQAHVLAMSYYSRLGDFSNAIEQAESALELDHKLYKENLFLVKASLLGLQGKNDSAIKVLEKWVSLYPENTEALSILGRNYLVAGNYQELAKKIYIKLYKKEGTGHNSLINLANIYRLQNDKKNAIKYLLKYQEAHPLEGRAYFELANAYRQFAMLDKAKEMYEEASLYGNKDFKAEIGLANIIAAKGDYKNAVMQLNTLLEKSKTDFQKIEILANLQEIYYQTGQIKHALLVNEQLVEPSSKTMPPLTALFQVKGSSIFFNALLGNFEEAEMITVTLKKDLKPPFDKLVAALRKYTFEYQHDIENYKKSLASMEDFMNSLNMATMKPDILRSKGILAFWENDYSLALDYFNQAIVETKQSFVTLHTSNQVDDLLHEKAKTLIALNKYNQAITNLDIILNRTPLFAKAHFLKAQAYNYMNDMDKVQQQLKKVHDIWKNADMDYIYYKNFIEFEKQLEL